METSRMIFFALALLACPVAYFSLLIWMFTREIARPPWLPYFFLFGTFGGWLLAFGLSPSGLAAMCILFLVTLAPLSVVISSIYLLVRKERSVCHRIALWGGFAYPALLALWVLVISVFH